MNFVWISLVILGAVSGQKSCKTIDDKAAPYQKLLALVQDISGKDLHGKLAKFQRFFSPEFEQCLANYEAPRIVPKLHPIFKSECSNISQLTNLSEISALKANLPTLPIAAHELFTVVPDFLTFLMTTTDVAYQNVCTAVSDIGLPCAGTIIQVLVSSLEDDSNGCCDAFLQQFEKKAGLNMKNWLYDMLVLTRNAVCAVKEPADQTCGYTLMQVYGSTNVFEFLNNVVHGLQIPNDQACDAFEGREFVLSNWDRFTLGNRTTGRIISGCSKPLDTLVSKVAAMPMIESDLFTAGRCVKVADLLQSAPISEKLVTLLTDFKIGSKCLHLANGFSATCDFSAQIKGELSSNTLPKLAASPQLPNMDLKTPPFKSQQPETTSNGMPLSIQTIFLLLPLTLTLL